MNRSKHPDRAPHKRTARQSDRTRNGKQIRITGSWDARPDKPAVRSTFDRAEARRIAGDMADTGAYVIVEQHKGNAVWRTLWEVDGPALEAQRKRAAAEQRRAERRAYLETLAQAEDDRRAAALARKAQQRAAADAAQRDRTRAAVARLMTQPPVPRDATGRTTARHTAGGRR